MIQFATVYAKQMLNVKEQKIPTHYSLICKIWKRLFKNSISLDAGRGAAMLGVVLLGGGKVSFAFCLGSSLFLESGLRQLMWVSSELPGRWLGSTTSTFAHTSECRVTTVHTHAANSLFITLAAQRGSMPCDDLRYCLYRGCHWIQLCFCTCVIQFVWWPDQMCGGSASACGWVRELGVEHSLSAHFCGLHVPKIYILGLFEECLQKSECDNKWTKWHNMFSNDCIVKWCDEYFNLALVPIAIFQYIACFCLMASNVLKWFC